MKDGSFARQFHHGNCFVLARGCRTYSRNECDTVLLVVVCKGVDVISFKWVSVPTNVGELMRMCSIYNKVCTWTHNPIVLIECVTCVASKPVREDGLAGNLYVQRCATKMSEVLNDSHQNVRLCAKSRISWVADG